MTVYIDLTRSPLPHVPDGTPAGAALEALLGLSGMVLGEPAPPREAHRVEADMDCAEAARCSDCRNRPLRLLVFHRPQDRMTTSRLLCVRCLALYPLAE